MNRIKYILGTLLGSLGLVPALAFAQQNLQLANNGIGGVLTIISNIIAMIVPILVALAIVVFLWGVLKFILNAADPDKRAEGRNFMIWGIVGIVVMVSVWGLVAFVQRAFGVAGGNVPAPRVFPGQ